MTQTIGGATAVQTSALKIKKKTRERDPYDGLRFWSAATHGIGAGASIVGGIALLTAASRAGLSNGVLLSLLVFVGSTVAMYLASCLYHSVNTSVQGRLFLRKLDHAMIYVLIAGTYTPVCLGVLGEIGQKLCLAVWSVALLGVLVTMFWLNAPRALTTVFYIGMGWMALLAIEPLTQTLSTASFAWMLAGGIVYTMGGILYALKWPCKNGVHFGCHEIFHLFVLGGSICFFMMMCTVFL